MSARSHLHGILSMFVTVHPHETSALLHSSSCFFFVSFQSPSSTFNPSVSLLSSFLPLLNFPSHLQILSAYFVVLPLRDEGAISLGLSNLPGLFLGSLFLTLVAAPVSTLIFSLPNLSKAKVSFQFNSLVVTEGSSIFGGFFVGSISPFSVFVDNKCLIKCRYRDGHNIGIFSDSEIILEGLLWCLYKRAQTVFIEFRL